ncbi:hypothetical protein TanjilG_19927 [Lupinus angustifolius]|uniref:Uncharacterized protein n=1 Tax=Lupinus angustifolius TaxID=3871 RepID=A0A1J7H343_LUPAN|nr:hypothetical protein TanjilG_19927 [Lupinus angustifolius]
MMQQKVTSTKCETKMKNLGKNKKNATVIPAPRKLVKTMIFESVVDFIIHLFSAEDGKPTKKEMMVTAPCCCRRKTKCICS